MLEVMCTRRYRDKNNVIVCYELQADNGQTRTVGSHDLKEAIRAKKLYVRNLQLTRDGKLMLRSNFRNVECRTFDIARKPVILDKDLVRELDFEGSLQFKANTDASRYITKLKLLGYTPKQLNSNLYVFTHKNSKIVLSPDKIIIKNAMELFEFSKFTSINLNGVDTSEITDTRGMFMNCSNLEKLDISNLGGRIVRMDDMFAWCSKLREVKIGEWFIGYYTTSASCMFAECSSLESLDLLDYETPDLSGEYESIRHIKCSPCSLESTYRMFAGCSSLKSLDLSNFYTHHTTSMEEMFDGCSSLESINLGDAFTTHEVENMSGMFKDCGSLKNIIFGENFKMHNVKNTAEMFKGCRSLESIDLSGFGTKYLNKLYSMFEGCESLRSVKLGELRLNPKDEYQVTDIFKNCRSLQSIDLSGLYGVTPISMYGWFEGCENLRAVNFGKNNHFAVNMCAMFKGCKRLEHVNLDSIRTSKLCSLDEAFEGCSYLKEVSLKAGELKETRDLLTVRNAFKGCVSLEKLDISALNTQKVGSQAGTKYANPDKEYYFEGFLDGCDNLKYVKVSSLIGYKLLAQVRQKAQEMDIVQPDGSVMHITNR